jgi:signal transduction histidine kinase
MTGKSGLLAELADLRGLPANKLERVNFTADAALVAELGERLVGQAQIALAELIKNSYDADAHRCIVYVGEDSLTVEDDGHGMTPEDFHGGWMRIGTQRKRGSGVSPGLGRPLTGSKGIGRLAAQFLGGELYLITHSRGEPTIECRIDWSKVTTAGDLVKATAEYREVEYKPRFIDSPHGTIIEIRDLKHDWDETRVQELARLVWFLRPPVLPRKVRDPQRDFDIELLAEATDVQETFERQMNAALRNWEARIQGRVRNGFKNPQLNVKVEFYEPTRKNESYQSTIEFESEGLVDEVDFQIRVFSHTGKQRRGVLVGDMRSYFNRYGGVHLADAGFRLPYYGVQHDWLDLEMAHSHRLSAANLLPEELRVDKALQELPTQTRLYGVVQVNTSEESRRAREAGVQEHLEIQITRDRLVDNEAYRQLRDYVLTGMQFYAAKKRLRKLREIEHEIEKRRRATPDRLISKIEQYQADMGSKAYEALRSEAEELTELVSLKERSVVIEKSVMASLATAGMAAIAMEHELKRQLGELRRRIKEARRKAGNDPTVAKILAGLDDWIRRAAQSRALVSTILDRESREDRKRYRARDTVEGVLESVRPLMRDAEVDFSQIPKEVRLPKATFAEWQAIFQNVLLNAVNAMLDSERQNIRVSLERGDDVYRLLIEDTGVGVELEKSERLFEPFKREIKISRARRNLGLGGSGLGLTIVRTIAEGIGLDARFVKPSNKFSTALCLEWKEEDHES